MILKLFKKFRIDNSLYRAGVFIINIIIQVGVFILYGTLFQFSDIGYGSYFSDFWTLYIILTIGFYNYGYIFLLINVIVLILGVLLNYL